MKTLPWTAAILVTLTAAHAHDAAADMAGAATHFLSSLSEPLRARARFPFESDERQNWHFIPRDRQGLRPVGRALEDKAQLRPLAR